MNNFFYFQKHQVLGCAKFPVNCATCGETGLLREDALLHMHPVVGDCPLAVIKCQFFDIGCFFQVCLENFVAIYCQAFMPNKRRTNPT